jgi:hypothetical protein
MIFLAIAGAFAILAVAALTLRYLNNLDLSVPSEDSYDDKIPGTRK